MQNRFLTSSENLIRFFTAKHIFASILVLFIFTNSFSNTTSYLNKDVLSCGITILSNKQLSFEHTVRPLFPPQIVCAELSNVELEEDADPDFVSAIKSHFFSINYNCPNLVFLSKARTTINFNSTPIPLFILFHSWKSFLI